MAATPTIVLVEQGWHGGRGKGQTRPRAGPAPRTFIRNAKYEAQAAWHERSIRGWLPLRRGALRRSGQPVYLRLGDQDGLGLSVRIDAPIGAEKPIPEIVDYRKIAIGIPVVEKMELLLSPEPSKLSQP